MIVLVHFYVAALIVFIVVNYYLVAPISARRNFRMHKALQHPYTYSWSEAGLEIVSSRGQWQVVWDDCLKWRENESILLFYQSPRLFHMFPKRVLTAEQIADIERCASHIVE